MFQIVIDCDTAHGARWFMDNRKGLRDILASVLAEVESVLVLETGHIPIWTTAIRIQETTVEMEIKVK